MTPAATPGLNAWLTARRTQIDAALAGYLPAPPAAPPVLDVAMRYSVCAGGKRFRPLLTLAAAEAVSRDAERAVSAALPAACAVEMVHTYSLIHDDLPAMDNDSLRRGQPTSHVVFGEGLAILAGDGLLTEAFGLIAREPVTTDAHIVARKLRAIDVLARAAGAAGMVGGQAIDLHAAGQVKEPAATLPQLAGAYDGRPTLDATSLRDMHARKTGALITAAAALGAVMAGGHDSATQALSSFAADLGLAFQIVDDVLDVEGAEAALGKTSGKDAAAGKATYTALFGLEQAKRLAREALDRALDTLARAGLSGRLPAFARWVVERSH
jgi:geranylgeranyl diphosphate synthase type II